MPPKFTRLPSGKLLYQAFDGAGQLVCESHTYPSPSGKSAIVIRQTFEKGRKTGEMYFVDGFLARRESYEQSRLQYADMPAADASVVDEGLAELEKLERKKRDGIAAARRLGLDPEKLTDVDLFCVTLMEKGRRVNAIEWVQSPDHTFGEMNERASRKLIEKLTKLGAAAIHACEIESVEGARENTGHLVVELPTESSTRKSLFKELARLARKQGFRGDPDEGQRFAYVKLD